MRIRTAWSCSAPRCAHHCTPCSGASAAHVHRGPHHRTPCKYPCAARARRCPHRRTPCTCSCAARAGKVWLSSLVSLRSLRSPRSPREKEVTFARSARSGPCPLRGLRSLRPLCPLRGLRCCSAVADQIRGPQKPKVRKIRPRRVKFCNSRNPCKRHLQRPASQLILSEPWTYSPRD